MHRLSDRFDVSLNIYLCWFEIKLPRMLTFLFGKNLLASRQRKNMNCTPHNQSHVMMNHGVGSPSCVKSQCAQCL